ncbi:MAG: hypothetical protein EPN22_17315, partial [Nitrospirae bacterium]
ETMTNRNAGTQDPGTLVDGSFEIGRRNYASGYYYYTGSIDDVRVYSRMLSASEVKKLYQLGAGAMVSKTPVKFGPLASGSSLTNNGLVGWWSFDKGYLTNTTATDRSASANHGTRVATTTPAAGKLGQGLAPESGYNSGYVSSTDSASLDVTNFSIGGWVKSDYSRMGSVVSKGSYALKIGGDNVPYTEIVSAPIATSTVGSLGSNITIHQMAVYNGKLYAATGSTTAGAIVYRYDGGSTWTNVGQLGSYYRATSLAVYKGKLYAGSRTPSNMGTVYRYEGGTTWTNIGDFSSGVYQLIVYNNTLYTAAIGGSAVYRYEGGTSWTAVCVGLLTCPSSPFTMTVYNGKLYVAGYSSNMNEYQGGTSWSSVAIPAGQNGITSLASFNGKLYAGGETSSTVFRYDSGSWTNIGAVGTGQNNIGALAVYNGALYAGAGSASGSKLFRYDGGATWTDVGMGNTTAILTMAVYDGKLFMGAGVVSSVDEGYNGDGSISSYGSGAAVFGNTSTPLNTGFNHVFSAYDGSSLKLYINGILSNSSSTSYAVSTTANGLFLGSSAGSSGEGLGEETMRGTIDDVRIYNRALSAAEIKKLATAGISTINKTPAAAGPAGGKKLATGLIGWWTFDGRDLTANTSTDKSGSGNHGTRTGTTAITGRIGQGLKFNGTSDYVSTPNMNIAASGATVSIWFRPSAGDIANGRIIIGKAANGNTYFETLNATTIRIQTDVEATLKNYTVPTMSSGIWYHLVVTRSSNTTRVYLNGVESTSGGQTQTDVMILNQIGRYSSGGSGFDWSGSLDDARVYSRALSAAEIQQLYRMGK